MKKGFTLIELLAVIVILAIIALIATPIVLDIIDNTKVSSNERSINLYKNAVENGFAKAQLNASYIPNGYYTGSKQLVNGDTIIEVEYTGTEVNCARIKYEDGDVTLEECQVGKNYVPSEILITSIEFNYPDCTGGTAGTTFLPEVSIEPSNATNKELKFTIDDTWVNRCKQSSGATSNYLTIDEKTGMLTKIKSTPTSVPTMQVNVTVETTDGSNISLTKNINFSIDGSTCDYIISNK